MDDSAPGQDGDSSDSTTKNAVPVITISPVGEVILDMTFENSPETIKAAKRSYQKAIKRPGATRVPEPNLNPRVRVAFRVEIDVLRKHSKYFDNLLGNKQFAEARLIEDALSRLNLENLKAQDEDPSALPWIPITDDDEATRSVGREKVLGDMLRILHDKPVQTGASAINMLYVTTLAVLADRFDCRRTVSRYLGRNLKFKWPVTTNGRSSSSGSGSGSGSNGNSSNQVSLRPSDQAKNSLANEQLLRQKILVAWLLEQPLKLHNVTREITMRGSVLWSALGPPEDAPLTEAWWELPDGLERELQYRREAILNTIASIQRHFLSLYSSRERQCKLGYDSSSACDLFQLGQMLKFFTGKGLVSLLDFGPSSLDALSDPAASASLSSPSVGSSPVSTTTTSTMIVSGQVDVDDLLATLRQCPAYQVDKNHTNCGLRTRIEPIVDYVQAMLSSNVVSVSHTEWSRNRAACSWAASASTDRTADGIDAAAASRRERRTFAFTRSLAFDQRLRYEGALYADKMARQLFTADGWDWTPEY
ncbi:hypothetical protein SODALDRAFT_319160 [Sodiomyces alkalinus F11]|uniref:Hydroxyproline-rich glyco protein n=1 Tax=Sodiomyces alkalinus (strain CBS 110278 / VKM F-3762 / F11) TaxID=1314773 RepID=A0A3N2Q796_SODAK|nr:hypothetical protein SODALDRAFT_319160 [Sodiomyces alkalinus F11]ROT42495.1 hypothetical protein SODALDRAFT_319160 [Sodiomyces alkalinus F11]